MAAPAKPHVSGFVSILGKPNAGKSTLMNAMVGVKLAIVAEKPQTTRTTVQGVLTLPGAQIVFLDTPGIHEPKHLLDRRMLTRIREALHGRDLLLFLVDATRPFHPVDEQALQWIRDAGVPCLLLLNKIDLLKDKRSLLDLIEQYRRRHDFAEYIPISALSGEGLDRVQTAILDRIPEGPQYFPEDYLTDQPERFLAAEIIREKILHLTRQEVPHSVAVLVDQWKDEARKDGSILTNILATIHVERPGQKKIVIGAKGETLKKIGALARKEMEALLGRRIYLELFVKVSEDWRNRAQFLNELDAARISQPE